MVKEYAVNHRIAFGVLVLCYLAFLPVEGRAALYTYGFQCITSNSVVDPAIGERQLFVDVSNYGSNQVLFTFRNEGPDACSIASVYFDDGNLLTLAAILDSPPDVDFTEGAAPPNLPAGVEVDFGATLSNSATSPPSKKGVNPGESLGILTNVINEPSRGFDFDDSGVVDFSDVLEALNRGLRDLVPAESLRIGLHVIAFDDEDSESFINGPAEVVPVPGAVLLGVLGLSAAGIRLRKSA